MIVEVVSFNTDYDSKLERAEKDWQFRTLNNIEFLFQHGLIVKTYLATYGLRICNMYVHCMYLDLSLSVITYNLMLHVLSILLYMYVCSFY